MDRTEKTEIVDRLRASLDGVPAVLLADFRGLKVGESDGLRSAMRAAQIRFEVVKNTLVKRAIAGTPMELLSQQFKGNTAIAYHPTDPVSPAKILLDYAKDHPNLVIKGGWLSGRLLDKAGVDALSKLPGKDELRARLLSVVVGVPTAFVRVLAAAPTGFVRVLQARAEALGK